MQRTEDGILRGEPEELLLVLEKEIAAHRESIHKAVDLAFEVLVQLHELDEEPIPGNESVMGSNMTSVLDWLEKETGVDLDTEARYKLADRIIYALAAIGGMSVCAVYEIAHAIEHKIYHETH